MDKQKILEELGSIDEATYDELVRECIAQTLSEVELLKEVLGKRDLLAAAKIAHGIKGSAGNLRLIKLQEAASRVELGAKENKTMEVIMLDLNRLEKAFAELKA